MKRLASSAHRRSMAELKVYFKNGLHHGTLEEVGIQNYREWLQKTFWGHLNEMANEKFRAQVPECGSRSSTCVTNPDDALCGLEDYVVNSWRTNETSGWFEVKLESHSYWITLSKGVLYVTASTMKTFRVHMPQERMVQMLFVYDAFLGRNDIDGLIEEAYQAYIAEEKANEVLLMAVKSIVEDIYPGNQRISIRQQKNGRLCCTIPNPVHWHKDMVFKTDMVNFRKNFIKALEKGKPSLD